MGLRPQDFKSRASAIPPRRLVHTVSIRRIRGRGEELEATAGIEPAIGVLQTPALTTWPRRLVGQ
jgi:hypothetical protein